MTSTATFFLSVEIFIFLMSLFKIIIFPPFYLYSVRAHQVVEDGYEFFHERALVTLFSAPNYCGQFDNAGAMMTVKEDLTCSFSILPVSYFLKSGQMLRLEVIKLFFFQIFARFFQLSFWLNLKS